MQKIHINEWKVMTPEEKEVFVFLVLGIYKEELAKAIAEFEFEHGGRKPNSIFIAAETLIKIPARIKKIMGLQVIPMDAQPEQFILSIQDPWQWGNLFYH